MEESKSEMFSTSKVQKISEGEYKSKQNEDFPYDLNKLCVMKFDFGFDALKDSIEWLAKR